MNKYYFVLDIPDNSKAVIVAPTLMIALRKLSSELNLSFEDLDSVVLSIKTLITL